jgi:hypothetical protein
LRSASLEVGGKKLVASNLHPPTSPQKTEKLQTKALEHMNDPMYKGYGSRTGSFVLRGLYFMNRGIVGLYLVKTKN